MPEPFIAERSILAWEKETNRMTNGEDGLWKDKNGKMHHHVKVAAIAALAFLGAFLVVQTMVRPQSSFQAALFAAIVGGILTLAGAKAVLPRGDS